MSHYSAVLKRLGVNLQTAAQEGRYVHIDAFSQPFSSWVSNSLEGVAQACEGAEHTNSRQSSDVDTVTLEETARTGEVDSHLNSQSSFELRSDVSKATRPGNGGGQKRMFSLNADAGLGEGLQRLFGDVREGLLEASAHGNGIS